MKNSARITLEEALPSPQGDSCVCRYCLTAVAVEQPAGTPLAVEGVGIVSTDEILSPAASLQAHLVRLLELRPRFPFEVADFCPVVPGSGHVGVEVVIAGTDVPAIPEPVVLCDEPQHLGEVVDGDLDGAEVDVLLAVDQRIRDAPTDLLLTNDLAAEVEAIASVVVTDNFASHTSDSP